MAVCDVAVALHKGLSPPGVCAGHFSLSRGDKDFTNRRCLSSKLRRNTANIQRNGSGTRLAKCRGGRPEHMRLRVTLFTAAFVMLPMAAFALLIGGMVWRRLSGAA